MDMKLLNDAGFNIDDHILKVATGVGGIAADFLVTWGMPADKSKTLVAMITAITLLVIAGISHVQSSKLKAQGAIGAAANTPQPAPATQTNVGSEVTNQPTATTKVDPAEAPHVTTPAPPHVAQPQTVLTLSRQQMQAIADLIVAKMTPPPTEPQDAPKGA